VLTGIVAGVVVKANAGNGDVNGSDTHREVEPSATEHPSESSDPATTTTKTTFDELMQALSELEADDPLPTSTRRGPSWRELNFFYFATAAVSVMFTHSHTLSCATVCQ